MRAATEIFTAESVMHELEALGSEQTRKTYARHGIKEPAFGVLYSSLSKIQKRIKTDHELARQQWQTGNHDARILATMIADPNWTGAKLITAWTGDVDNYVLGGALSQLAALSPDALAIAYAWRDDESEWRGQVAWGIFARLGEQGTLDDALCDSLLGQIGAEIHRRKSRARYTMLCTLIGIGLKNEEFKGKALAVATKIGNVEVDYLGTSCKTANPLIDIEKAYAYKNRKR